LPPDRKLIKDFAEKQTVDGGKADMANAMNAILGRKYVKKKKTIRTRKRCNSVLK
jgi:hypothetical protein